MAQFCEDDDGFYSSGSEYSDSPYSDSSESDPDCKPNESIASIFDSPGTYLFTGPTGSGKTYFLRRCMKSLNTLKNFAAIIVFSSSARINTDYDFLPQDCVFGDDLEKRFRDLLLERENETEEYLNSHGRSLEGLPPVAVILDDPVGKMNVNNRDGIFSEYSTKIRKLNVWLFIQQQRWNTASSIIRENTESNILFNESRSALEDIYERSTTIIQKQPFIVELCKWMKEKYQFMVFRRSPPVGVDEIELYEKIK